jgi:hypothetical protein
VFGWTVEEVGRLELRLMNEGAVGAEMVARAEKDEDRKDGIVIMEFCTRSKKGRSTCMSALLGS